VKLFIVNNFASISGPAGNTSDLLHSGQFSDPRVETPFFPAEHMPTPDMDLRNQDDCND
jgi:hypothetical protein